MAYWHNRSGEVDQDWRESVRLACRWAIDRSLVRSRDPGIPKSSFRRVEKISDWRGAFRGEYSAERKEWDFYCPIWHGGQGVKALALAHAVLGDADYLDAARQGAEFILRHQISDPSDPDYGLILAYEGTQDGINTSAILESLDGLFVLSEVSGESRFADAAMAALRWVQRTMFLPEEGLFQDDYEPGRGVFRDPARCNKMFPRPGRPLLDDGVYAIGGRLAKDDSLSQVAVCTAERLLQDEDPAGNWKAYQPARPDTGVIHPRHAYWWGRPMWMVYKATGNPAYLECCRRSAEWYVHAMRTDGGLFRQTDGDFRTPSFGHATSGIACAAILWIDLIREFGDEQWIKPLQKALGFCRSVQFTEAADSNLLGSILEKILPPSGRDAPPWHLRDIGTFFYIQAVCLALRDLESVLP